MKHMSWRYRGTVLMLVAAAGLSACSTEEPFVEDLVGRVGLPGQSRYLAVSGDRAYVGNSLVDEVSIVDISRPERPVLVGGLSPTPNMALAATSDLLLAGGFGTLGIHDVSDESAIRQLSSINTPAGALGVAVSGGTAYVAEQNTGLKIVDLADPGNPVLRATLGLGSPAFDVALSGTLLYVAAGSHLVAVDVSDPASPVVLDSLPMPPLVSAYDVAVAGTTVYVASLDDGLQVIDATDPADLKLLSALPSTDNSLGVAAVGNRVYLADASAGLQVIDVTVPSSPVRLARISVPGGAFQVAINGGHAVVASGAAGLQIFDISGL